MTSTAIIYCAVSVYVVGHLRLERGANEITVAELKELTKGGRVDGVRLRLEPGDDCKAMTASDAKAWIGSCDALGALARIHEDHPTPSVRDAALGRVERLVEQLGANVVTPWLRDQSVSPVIRGAVNSYLRGLEGADKGLGPERVDK